MSKESWINDTVSLFSPNEQLTARLLLSELWEKAKQLVVNREKQSLANIVGAIFGSRFAESIGFTTSASITLLAMTGLYAARMFVENYLVSDEEIEYSQYLNYLEMRITWEKNDKLSILNDELIEINEDLDFNTKTKWASMLSIACLGKAASTVGFFGQPNGCIKAATAFGAVVGDVFGAEIASYFLPNI